MKKISIAFIILTFVAFLTPSAFATQSDYYKVICHHTPGNNVTLSFQNEQSYDGHLGTPHNDQTFDTDGACQEPSAEPTATPTDVPNPCDNDKYCTLGCDPEPSVTPVVELTITPTDEPSPTSSPSATPEPSSPPTGGTGGGDGRSDGQSDGQHQAPDGLGCAVHECKVPQGPPATGRGR